MHNQKEEWGPKDLYEPTDLRKKSQETSLKKETASMGFKRGPALPSIKPEHPGPAYDAYELPQNVVTKHADPESRGI